MKQSMILFAVMIASLLTMPMGSLATERADNYIGIPLEHSMLMLDERYQTILEEKIEQAANNKHDLRIVGISTLDIKPNRYAYVYLAVRPANSSSRQAWTQIGSITGSFVVSSRKKIELTGVFFSPAPEFPGGASVGNN